jgi:catalase
VYNYQRDGPNTINGNGGATVNYEPNSLNGPKEDPSKAVKRYDVKGTAGRNAFENMGDIDYEQPR